MGWSDLQMVINRGLNKKEGLRASPHCRAGLALPRNCARKQARVAKTGMSGGNCFQYGKRLRAVTPTVLTVSVAMVEL